jgi:hypothetical protein
MPKLKKMLHKNLARIIVISYIMIFVYLLLPIFEGLNLSSLECFAIAACSFLINRIIDYNSTCKALREFDKDFWKYHLGRFFGELSPTLPRYPTLRDIISTKILVINTLVFVMLFTFPIFWYDSYVLGTVLCFSFLMTSPIVYVNNIIVANSIRACKKVGKAEDKKLFQ